MTITTKKAVIYCRNACAEQAQPSSKIIQQETECRLFAEKKGYQVVQTFHDDGQSGMTVNRPGFRLMLVTLLAAAEPYTIITTSIDRLSRDVNDFASICQIIGGLNGELIFTSDHTAESAGRVA